MKPSMVVTAALRESRGARGRLTFFVLCLALGVAAITGVSALVGSIQDALQAQSRELMGADVAVDARRPIPAELDAYFAVDGRVERADAREMATLASAGGKSKLVELKAVSASFPFYGGIRLDPPGVLGQVLDERSCVAAPELMRELGVGVGDVLGVGGQDFAIAAAVLEEPGRLDIAFTLGPRLFVSLDGLARTNLVGFGSRIRYRALYELPRDPGEEWLQARREDIRREVADAPYLRIESHRDAQPTVRRSLRRVERYLGLVALLSLILGGVGVAQIVRAWLAARTQGVAVMRVVGFRPREVLAMYLGHVALLALAGSALGALLGSLTPFAIPAFAPELLPAGFSLRWEPLSMLRGIVLGVATALVFSVPPLTAIWRVAPARVLRNDAEPLPAPRIVTWSALLLLAAGVFGAAWSQSRDLVLAASFTGGLAVVALVLGLAARALTWAAARMPRHGLDPYLRHGVAALARPGVGVLGATVALGLGVLVVLTMMLVETRLSERLRTALPEDAPTLFLLDVQPDQWPDLEPQLAALGATGVDSVPVVTARLAAIDGVAVQELATQRESGEGPRRPRWVLTREQRLTWMRELPDDNRLVEGSLWSDPERLEVSLERDFATDLGVGLGSKLAFDVQGVPVELVVTSIRTVEWETFGINFFLIAEPGALEEAPHFRLVAARLDVGGEGELEELLSRDYSNVTPIRIRAILEKVLGVLTRLAVGVRALGLFTILTGLAILAGVASAAAVHRGREVALLKTLGLTRAGVGRLFGIEFALVGLVAGTIGAAAALALSWAFLEHVVEIGGDLPWWSAAPAALVTAAASALCGLLASARALASRPIESLRG